MWWLGVLIVAAIAAAVARSRGMHLLPAPEQKLLPAASDALARWAEDNGWKLYGGDDKQIRGEAWTLFSMAGPPSLETLYAVKELDPRHQVVEPAAYFAAKWELAQLLRRDTAEGQQTIVGAVASFGGTRAVIACIATRGTIQHFGLDAFGWPVQLRSAGEPPENLDFDAVLAGFGTPLRLRFAEGVLLLRVPGELSPELASTVLERLEQVRDALPRRPDLGPQR